MTAHMGTSATQWTQKTILQEMVPRVSCPGDEHPMYLAEVQPEKKKFSLWQSPECNASRTNEESLHGLGKKIGARILGIASLADC
jgi:hypothetical protein